MHSYKESFQHLRQRNSMHDLQGFREQRRPENTKRCSMSDEQVCNHLSWKADNVLGRQLDEIELHYVIAGTCCLFQRW